MSVGQLEGRLIPVQRPPAPRRRAALLTGGSVGALYLLVAVVVWWQVWSGHPTSSMTCACGDPSLILWSFGSVGHALAHGQNPFSSTEMWHPGGVNLLANVSAMLESTVLAPVTWVFGPVASLNVENTLAPVLSAAASYWAARRSLRVSRPAAFVVGLLVEISPFVISSVSVSHVQTSMLCFVPVIGVCLHELVVRQQGRPWRWGLILAFAAIGQFFTSTEVTAILAFVGAVILGLTLVGTLVRAARGHRSALVRLRHASTGLAVAGAVSLVVLAYPAWYALAGPRHFSGSPWPGTIATAADRLRDTVSMGDVQSASGFYHLGGYEGPPGAPSNYLGIAALVVAALALVVLWRRAAVWALAALAAGATWLSLGAVEHTSLNPFLPWKYLQKLPVLAYVLAPDFAVLSVLAVAALVGLMLDRIAGSAPSPRRPHALPTLRWVLAAAVAAAVIAPIATAWALPLTAPAVDEPAWFAHEARHLPAHSVVLAYPFVGPPGNAEVPVWQAQDRMSFAIVGGNLFTPGPDGKVFHRGAPESATEVLGALSFGLAGPMPSIDDRVAMASVRAAVARWGVTTVVVVDRGRDPVYAVRWFTAMLGRAPTNQDGASVWTVQPA